MKEVNTDKASGTFKLKGKRLMILNLGYEVDIL